MKEKKSCPICRKRALDICATAYGEVLLELKCPHCRNIIQIRHRGTDPSEKRQKNINILTTNY